VEVPEPDIPADGGGNQQPQHHLPRPFDRSLRSAQEVSAAAKPVPDVIRELGWIMAHEAGALHRENSLYAKPPLKPLGFMPLLGSPATPGAEGKNWYSYSARRAILRESR
jgi:hypothetical protein